MQTAIATSLNLRCYGVLSPRQDGAVAIAAPDLEADHAWEISELPWSLVPKRSSGSSPSKELDAALLAEIEKIVEAAKPTKTGTSASVAFLYVLMEMAGTKENA